MAKPVRKSVTLTPRTARRVSALAKSQQTSAGRILAALVEAGLETKEAERQHYLGLVDQLSVSTEAEKRRQLKRKLARLTFGA